MLQGCQHNYVERRMAPLSKELAGLVLPHDTCGTHLDPRQRTIDVELEKMNFKKAGEILAEIWSQLVLDGHPIVAEYVEEKQIQSCDMNRCQITYAWKKSLLLSHEK